jgi:hypothetical protein
MEYIVPAIKRRLGGWTTRRHDKLFPFLGLVLAALIPIMVCYGIPSLIANINKTLSDQKQAQLAAQNTLFVEQYSDLVHLCDDPSELQIANREMPASPKVIIVEYGGRSRLQDELPAEWQPSKPEDVTVVVCLNRDQLILTPQCADGKVPDFTPFIGYEATAVADGTFKGGKVPGDTIFHHPAYTGQVLARYQTTATLLDTRTGKAFRAAELWGADPPACSGSQVAGIDTPKTLGGERISDDDLTQWMKSLLGI